MSKHKIVCKVKLWNAGCLNKSKVMKSCVRAIKISNFPLIYKDDLHELIFFYFNSLKRIRWRHYSKPMYTKLTFSEFMDIGSVTIERLAIALPKSCLFFLNQIFVELKKRKTGKYETN